jgi:hypothetical protein
MGTVGWVGATWQLTCWREEREEEKTKSKHKLLAEKKVACANSSF